MTVTVHAMITAVDDAAQALPPDQRHEFLDRVSAMLASHAETPTKDQVELAIRLARDQQSQVRELLGR